MGQILIDHGALQTVLNVLRRDSEDGRPVRGEMADELVSATARLECVGCVTPGGKLSDTPPTPGTRPVFIVVPNATGKGRA